MDIMFTVGVGWLIIAVIVLIFAISWTINAKTYYKAEVEYVENRKSLLNQKVDFLDKRIDDIIEEAAGYDFAEMFMNEFESWYYFHIEEPADDLQNTIYELESIHGNLHDLVEELKDTLTDEQYEILKGNVDGLEEQIDMIQSDIDDGFLGKS